MPNGRIFLREHDSIHNDWLGHEHECTSPIWKNATKTFGMKTDKKEEELNHFARRLAHWLERRSQELDIHQLVMFCPPRLLGALRRLRGGNLAKITDERTGEFVHLPLNILLNHPRILDVLGAKREGLDKTLARRLRGGKRGNDVMWKQV